MVDVSIDSYNSSGSYQNQSSITWAHTVSGTSRVLLVFVKNDRNVAVTSVTYGGQTMLEAVELNRNAGIGVDFIGRIAIWYLIAPPLGTANVVVTLPSSQSSFGYSVSANNTTGPSFTDIEASVKADGSPYLGAVGFALNGDSAQDMGIGMITTPQTAAGTGVTSGTQVDETYDNGLTRNVAYVLNPHNEAVVWNVSFAEWGVVALTLKAGDQGSASPSTSPSVSPSASPSLSPSTSPSVSPSSSLSPSKSPSLSPSTSPSVSPSQSLSPSVSPSVSPSSSLSPSISPSVSPSSSVSPSASRSPSISPSASPSRSSSLSPSQSPSTSPSPSPDNYVYQDTNSVNYVYEDEELEKS